MVLRPPTPGSLVMLVAGGILFATAQGPLALAAGEVLAVALLVTAVHVLAHVGAARALGVPVYTVLLGGGPRMIGVQRGAVTVELRALPVGGSVSFYPEDVDPGEAEDPPPQAVLAMMLAAPMASVALAAVLLGPQVAEAIGLIPDQLWALMTDPGGRGRDVAYSALHLTDQPLAVVVGTVAAKLGVVQIPANLLLIGRSLLRLAGADPSEAGLLVLGLLQVVLTTWALFGFVYALSLVLEG